MKQKKKNIKFHKKKNFEAEKLKVEKNFYFLKLIFKQIFDKKKLQSPLLLNLFRLDLLKNKNSLILFKSSVSF